MTTHGVAMVSRSHLARDVSVSGTHEKSEMLVTAREPPSTVDGSKGSLYHLDEAAKLSRRRYEEDPVVIIAEPNGRRRYVR